MQIPPNPKQSPLELVHMKLYSTGLQKVYTTRFYKSMNHNFGVELLIKNNTSYPQQIKVGGCVYDEIGNTIVHWNKLVTVSPHNSLSHDFYVYDNTFSQLKAGKYSVQFWLNDAKVTKKYFTITYK